MDKTEEKGSDVNLASHLLRDAFSKKFEVAVLITNDSDLAEPVRIVAPRTRTPGRYPQPTSVPQQGIEAVRHLPQEDQAGGLGSLSISANDH